MHSLTDAAAPTVQDRWATYVQELALLFEPKEQQVAVFLSKGFTWEETAERATISIRTVANYCKKNRFHEYVKALAANHHRELEPALMRNFHVALDVQHEVLTGRLDAKSDRYAIARELIQVLIRQLAARRIEAARFGTGGLSGATEAPGPIDVTHSAPSIEAEAGDIVS